MTNTLHWKRTFFTIFTGQAFSLLGSSIAQFSIIWWLTSKTESAIILTIASIMGFLPQALLGPFAGTLIDRYSRKFIMIASDMTIAVSSAVLAIGFMLGEPPIWAIYTVLAIRSIGSGFHMPSMQASLPLIAPEDQLMKIAGWNQTLFSAVAMVGPMLGALILAVFAIEWVLFIDVIGAMLASAALLFVHIPRPVRSTEDTEHPNFIREMKAGFRELTKVRGIMLVSLAMAVTTFVFVPVGALFNLIVLEHFRGGAWHAGIVELSFGAGMLLGAVILGTWGANKKQVPMMALGMIVLGGGLAIAGMLPPSAFIWFVVCSLIMGISGPLFGGPFTVLIQTSFDPGTIGRVMSILNSMMLIATPVGLLVAGPVAERIGVAPWFLISGILIILVGCSSMLIRLESKEQAGETAAE